jgi:HlyD family secretion protein
MDRALPPDVVRQAQHKKWSWAVAGVLILVLSVWALRRTFFNTVRRADIRTAVVERGMVENTLLASGEVRPASEQLIVSPITAVLERVYLNEGATVAAGAMIVELDKSVPLNDLAKQKDQLLLKRNGIVKLKLELDKSYYDLLLSDSIKLFRINALRADLESARRLLRAGGGTREAVEKVQNDLEIALLEKKQLENDLRTRQAIMQTSIRESEITSAIQEKDLQAFERKLQQANIAASRSGVLTYVNKNIGSKINEGETLARIADLDSYKLLGSISDNYLPQMRVGMPVVVRVGTSETRGRLVNVYPAVSNNIVTFDVAFDGENKEVFRPNMKVEVFLVTDQHTNILRIANGPAFTGVPSQDVFVLRADGKLERRTIQTGLSSYDFVEIIAGVAVGETVVISDLKQFKHANLIDLK